MTSFASPPRAETPVSPLVSPTVDGFPTIPSAQQQRLSERHEEYNVSPLLRPSPAPTMSRSGSVSSFSNTSGWTSQFPSSPTNVHPPPAYVAAFGASQVVSERKRHFSDDEDDDIRTTVTARDDMQFSSAALALLNAFLDQQLYSILAHAKSTTFTALRPAVNEVLKSRLAAEAIASAEEELQELLAGGEDEEEEMNYRQTMAERNRAWDTELVWKRTRLRVMVYIRLGEMEDDDEERYVREAELFHGSDRRFSHSTGLVSWAAAIFLTSVLEYVAEQVLQAAGRAADSRVRRQSKASRGSLSASGRVTPVDGVTVEDYDMEKVALNPTLGRLWRTWRKSSRTTVTAGPLTPTISSNNFSRRFSRDVFGATLGPRHGGAQAAGPEPASGMDDFQRSSGRDWGRDTPEPNLEELPEAQYPEHILAANIPLPLIDEKQDVDEIEIPGLAKDPDDWDTQYPEHVLAAQIPLPLVNEKRDVNEIETPGLARDPDEPEVPEHVLAAQIPLPLTDEKRDVDEIEVPGLARNPDDLETDVNTAQMKLRPKRRNSLTGSAPPAIAVGTLIGMDHRDVMAQTTPARLVETVSHQRSMSMPLAHRSPSFEFLDDEVVSTVVVGKSEIASGQTYKPKSAEREIVSPGLESPSIDKSSQDGAATQPEKKRLGDMSEIITAGSAAAAAAAVSIVYGSGFGKKEAKKSVAETDIDERDNQKHLLDMKRQSTPVVSKVVLQEKEELETAQIMLPKETSATAPVVQTKSGSETPESFTLVDESEEKMFEHPIAKPRHLSTDFGQPRDDEDGGIINIGVAQTSDAAVPTPRVEEVPAEWRYARDDFTNPAPRRQSRLILGEDLPPAPSSPQRNQSPSVANVDDVSPQSFLERRSLSVTAKPPQTEKSKSSMQAPHEQTRSLASKSPNQANAISPLPLANVSTSSPQPSSQIEKTSSPWQPFSAAATNSAWAAIPKNSSSLSESSSPVHEHPVVQKMVNIKKADGSKPKEEEKIPLTSASIKGPEDFEMFVQGGDTVKYTLTPENVRGEFVGADAKLRQSPTDRVPYSSAAAVETISPVGRKQSPPLEPRVGRSNSVRQATSAMPVPPDEPLPRASNSKDKDKRRSLSRPPARNTSVHRKSGLMAREPQVVTESTKDFADFIRSTGPTKEPEVFLLNNRSTTSLQSSRPPTARSSSPGGRSLNRAPMKGENVPPLPPVPGKVKSYMQPRGATSNTDSGTSDLAEFIRTGPNESGQQGQPRQHRISRTVAPFRTTMDSDQMNEWGNRIAAQPDLKLDTKINSAPSLKSASSLKTTRTSANSRSALLNNSSAAEAVHPAHSGLPQRLSGKPLSSTSGERKQYRLKDPYTIDFLDEDDDDDLVTALPRNRREEESLADFLRDGEPSADNGPRSSINGGISKTQPAGAGRESTSVSKARADSASMGRGGSNTANEVLPPKTVANMAAPRIQGTTSGGAAGSTTKPRAKMEARSGVISANGGSMNELADFLRSSGPTETTTTKPLVDPRHSSKASVTSSIRSKSSRMSGLFSGGLFGRKSART